MITKHQIEENIKNGWAVIDGFPFHRVTIDGRVQTMFRGSFLTSEWRDMRPDTDKREGKGYKRARIIYQKKQSRQSVHRLVATYFIYNPESKAQVNHKNGVKDDNRAENLEWCTARENIVHAVETGLNPGVRGEQQGQSKLTQDSVLEIRDLLKSGIPQWKIAEKYHVHQMTISKINTGRLWRHVA